MVYRKKCVILVVLMFVSCVVAGCRKEGEEPGKKGGSGETAKSRAMKACEKVVKGYFDALAAKDYRGAVEFIDVEEMLEKEGKGAPASPATADAAGMKDALVRMMAISEQHQKGKLSYEILASHVSGGKASVEMVVYRDGKLADRGMYSLTKRNGGWKLRGSAVRALGRPMKRLPSEPGVQ